MAELFESYGRSCNGAEGLYIHRIKFTSTNKQFVPLKLLYLSFSSSFSGLRGYGINNANGNPVVGVIRAKETEFCGRIVCSVNTLSLRLTVQCWLTTRL